MFDIVKDVKSGNLPADEIPGFISWAIRKVRNVCLSFALGGGIVALTIMLSKVIE